MASDATAAEAVGGEDGGSGRGESGEGGHAGTRTYLAVAGILAVLTALEVMVFYVPALRPVLVPILVTMMAAKFALVVLFFMHLRYDSRVLGGLFVGALAISVAVVIAMMALYEKLFV